MQTPNTKHQTPVKFAVQTAHSQRVHVPEEQYVVIRRAIEAAGSPVEEVAEAAVQRGHEGAMRIFGPAEYRRGAQ